MTRHNMAGASRRSCLPVLLACVVSLSSAQEKGKTDRFPVRPDTTITIANEYGPITVRAIPGNQVVVTTGPHSADVQVIEDHSAPDRVEIRTHHTRPGGSEPVDFTIEVPPTTPQVVIRTASGKVNVSGISGSVAIDSDTGSVNVEQGASASAAGASHANLRVHTIDGPVTLSNLNEGKIDVTTVSGAVTLNNSDAPVVAVNTNSAPIHFSGNPAAGSSCDLSTHSADIDVSLPPSASVDVTASSVKGSVQDGFQLQPDAHPALAPAAGKSFAGHANSGGAKLSLRTFSGKITVSKQ